MNDLLDAASSDAVIVSIITRVCTGMTNQNTALLSLLESGDNCVSTTPTPPPSNWGFIPRVSINQSVNQPRNNEGDYPEISQVMKDRRPLHQAPLGAGSGSWSEMGRKHQKVKKQKTPTFSADRNGDDDEPNSGGNKEQLPEINLTKIPSSRR